jgi:hypothetical protein
MNEENIFIAYSGKYGKFRIRTYSKNKEIFEKEINIGSTMLKTA